MRDRRHFLKVLGATASTFVIGCGSDGGGKSEASGTFSGGNTKTLAVGSIVAVSGQPVVVARDTMGVYAMSTICTHEQCDMNSSDGEITNTGLKCTCHGSDFDVNGTATAGPAKGQLKHYQVTISATGDISINAGATVDGAVRVAVPA
jgi:nitrite reductase/ring-hydroxylating ferredoxin subunit